MMRDPLLRSTGVLSALFHEGAVVCEGDSDRAFYQEINQRLVASDKRAAPNSLFMNAHNWQSIRRIIRPLRQMGIPAAAVVDLDVVKNSDLKELLHAAFVPDALVHSLGVLRGQLDAAFKETGTKDMNQGGLALLSEPNREAAGNFRASLAEYGVFVVPGGAVESWLSHLGITGAKKEWLPSVFARMGTDKSVPEYVQAAEGDVWDFVSSIGAWISDPSRKGMPA